MFWCQIYDLVTLKLLRLLEAHNGVLLALDFSPGTHTGHGAGEDGQGGGSCLLASGGRDGLIHLFDATVGLLDALKGMRAPLLLCGDPWLCRWDPRHAQLPGCCGARWRLRGLARYAPV
jgi:hypothetical protein